MFYHTLYNTNGTVAYFYTECCADENQSAFRKELKSFIANNLNGSNPVITVTKSLEKSKSIAKKIINQHNFTTTDGCVYVKEETA